jgi:hypothetical protein
MEGKKKVKQNSFVFYFSDIFSLGRSPSRGRNRRRRLPALVEGGGRLRLHRCQGKATFNRKTLVQKTLVRKTLV